MFRNLSKSIRANLMVGVVLTVPVVATILIFDFLFRITTNWLPAEAFPQLRTVLGGYLLRFLTLLAVLLFFYVIGLLARNFLGRRLYQLGDRVLARIPFIRNIYVSVRQISASLFTQRKTLFKEVVLVEYPRKGLYSIAFVTATAPVRIASMINSEASREDNDCVSLFIATTPNPTSGIFILVPKSDIMPLNIPVTDALTFIMSAGAVPPGESGDHAPTLLDKLEAWLKHGEESTPERIHENTRTD
jgi:uncharacterized membrane protein